MTPREYFEKFVVSRLSLKGEQTAVDIGYAVVFLVSDGAKNINGGTRMD